MRAVQAFTFFRRSLDETAKQLAERSSMSSDEAARRREDIAGLADRVLLGRHVRVRLELGSSRARLYAGCG